jgi:hypothetical protein
MNRRLLWGLLIGVAVFLGFNGDSFASGWEEIWENLSSGKTIESGVGQSAALYDAHADFTIYDGDNQSNNFSDSDRIDLVINNKATGKSLAFAGTKPELVEWAKANSGALLNIIFPSSPETSISGVTVGQFTNQQLLTAAYGSMSNVRNFDIQVSGQYDFFELGPQKIKATGSSGMFSYDHEFGGGNHALGVIIPYRNIKSEDNLESKMLFFSLMPFYKYSYNMKNNLVIEWITDLNVGVVYLKSGLFPDGGGYLQYGGGTGVSASKDLYENLHSKIGLHYQMTKNEIPESLVPDELKWVSDALNNQEMEHDLTVSGGVTYDFIPETWDISTNLMRIHQLQSGVDGDYKYQTVWNIYTTYTFKLCTIQLGYKTSFELKDYSDNSIIFSTRFNW